MSCNRRETTDLFVAERGQGAAGRAGRRRSSAGKPKQKSCKGLEADCAKEGRRKINNNTSFVLLCKVTAPRDADPILFALPKKNGRGGQGGRRVSGERAFHLRRMIVGISHRSAHLSDEEKKKKLSKFFFSLDSGQFRSRGGREVREKDVPFKEELRCHGGGICGPEEKDPSQLVVGMLIAAQKKMRGG